MTNDQTHPLPVTYRLEGTTAYVTLNNPPVNAIGATSRQLLVNAANRAEADGAERVILSGAGRMFSAGADIREFNQPVEPPLLPDVMDRVETCSVPWIAALHGLVLGGGCELMLSCRYRIATPDVSIGLPEVKLGLVPGAGGTQRLPRLIGAKAAMEMICSGEPVTGDWALGHGLIEAKADDPVEAARHVPHATLQKTPPVGQRRSAPPGQEIFETAKQQAQGTAPREAIALIQSTWNLPLDEGLAEETRVFFELREGEESKKMRQAFFAAQNPRKRQS